MTPSKVRKLFILSRNNHDVCSCMHVLYKHILFVCASATKSLSSSELEAIIICSSLFVVGVLIITTILSVFGFVFKKKQFQAVQVLNSAHTCTSSANISDRQIRPTFHYEGVS